MNKTNFINWFLEKVIHNSPPNSLIVKHNAPNHTVQVNKTLSSSKLPMQNWIINIALSYLPTI